jgi:hypothetical protein
MSSLAAVQADGYYNPEAKSRQRSNASQFARTGKVRFELMYKGQCTRCKLFMGKGTRFNAKKEQVGMYLTSKIWEFRMTCKGKGCSEILVVRTDPKNAEFIFVSGMKRIGASRVTTDTTKTSSTSSSSSNHSNSAAVQSMHHYNSHKKQDHNNEEDAMDALERQKEIQEQLDADAAQLTLLKKHADQDHGNNVASNSRLRKAHRIVRHEKERLARQGKKLGIGGPLLPKQPEDGVIARRERAVAKMIKDSRHQHQSQRKRKAPSITKQSIFSKNKKTSSFSSTSATRLKQALQRLPRARLKLAVLRGPSSSGSSNFNKVVRSGKRSN